MYGVEVSPALISQVTNAIEEDRIIWQNRLLDPIIPLLILMLFNRLSGSAQDHL